MSGRSIIYQVPAEGFDLAPLEERAAMVRAPGPAPVSHFRRSASEELGRRAAAGVALAVPGLIVAGVGVLVCWGAWHLARSWWKGRRAAATVASGADIGIREIPSAARVDGVPPEVAPRRRARATRRRA